MRSALPKHAEGRVWYSKMTGPSVLIECRGQIAQIRQVLLMIPFLSVSCQWKYQDPQGPQGSSTGPTVKPRHDDPWHPMAHCTTSSAEADSAHQNRRCSAGVAELRAAGSAEVGALRAWGRMGTDGHGWSWGSEAISFGGYGDGVWRVMSNGAKIVVDGCRHWMTGILRT